MTDKELLELAARASGISVLELDEYTITLPCGKEWNPLTGDGDAFRLAVKLIEFEPYKSRGLNPFFTTSAEDTRRAIVRAAAEIGRQL